MVSALVRRREIQCEPWIQSQLWQEFRGGRHPWGRLDLRHHGSQSFGTLTAIHILITSNTFHKGNDLPAGLRQLFTLIPTHYRKQILELGIGALGNNVYWLTTST